MKYSCDLVRDLLPLYYDAVCSDSSKEVVEEHLSECEFCKTVLKRYENRQIDTCLSAERADVVEHHTRAVKRKSLIVGLCFASVLAIPILVCLIINLATGQALDWFFIVLTALMVLGSVTAVPLIAEREKLLWSLGSFTGSLLLLLLVTCLYVNGSWFFSAALSVLFGLSIVFLPYVVYRLPLKGFLARQKGLLVMATDSILLYAIVITAGLHGSFADFGKALLLTTIPALFPWILFATIRYLKASGWIKAGISAFVCGAFLSFTDSIVSWIATGVLHLDLLDANLFGWEHATIHPNVCLLMLLGCAVAGAVLIAVGMVRRRVLG